MNASNPLPLAATQRPAPRERARLLRSALPGVSLAVLLVAIFIMQPRAMSYLGLNLMLNLAVPIALATMAQMLIITVNDLDLSLGSFISFVACVAATVLGPHPWLGSLALLGCIAVYAALGALVHGRNLPAIVVTLGMSFIWMGAAILLLPSPGGAAPAWLQGLVRIKTPLLPLAIFVCMGIALLMHAFLARSTLGVILRGAGGNPQAIGRRGWSLLRIKAGLYGLAGTFGVLSGLFLVGLTTSADANIALRYTLLSIAGVILGGGEFVGGRVSAVGAVLGALTLVLAGSLLSFLHISPDWQIGAQGAILILVLALRAGVNRLEARP
ncbi:ABC transporter permease [Pseudomonas typographi]|uniref:ABC transporter permease n=1 Tax=Pseudomonas typographi TaxID=2715964 RepID=A0ABR7Z1A9_9PSED|nr:ABC transporter permease [Pseudomonas typographi]MBD1554803.1 ABC transporter permease [Pseudomonas typographi]MBD1587326.1 ABC transporter permease [Pseudomonas typographi]MBD1599178.1 ABC transporter permease [Pseudomonas typographi]